MSSIKLFHSNFSIERKKLFYKYFRMMYQIGDKNIILNKNTLNILC